MAVQYTQGSSPFVLMASSVGMKLYRSFYKFFDPPGALVLPRPNEIQCFAPSLVGLAVRSCGNDKCAGYDG